MITQIELYRCALYDGPLEAINLLCQHLAENDKRWDQLGCIELGLRKLSTIDGSITDNGWKNTSMMTE